MSAQRDIRLERRCLHWRYWPAKTSLCRRSLLVFPIYKLCVRQPLRCRPKDVMCPMSFHSTPPEPILVAPLTSLSIRKLGSRERNGVRSIQLSAILFDLGIAGQVLKLCRRVRIKKQMRVIHLTQDGTRSFITDGLRQASVYGICFPRLWHDAQNLLWS